MVSGGRIGLSKFHESFPCLNRDRSASIALVNPLIIGTAGRVSSIDPATGSILWTTQLETGGFMNVTKGQDVSVLLRDGVIYAGSVGHLFGLSAATGQILWHNELKGQRNNDISLAMEGVSVQYLQKVVHRNDAGS